MSAVPSYQDIVERRQRLGMVAAAPVIRMDIIRPAPKPKRVKPVLPVSDGRDWIHVASPSFSQLRTRVVVSVVAKSFGVSQMDIISRRKHTSVFVPRAVVCWILREHSNLSLPQIGMRLGGRDHTTIINAIRKVDDLRARSPEFVARIDELVATARAEDDRLGFAA